MSIRKPLGLKVGKSYTLTQEHPRSFKSSGWTYETQVSEVRLLAVSGIWAMVRHKGAVPFVCEAKELSEGA